MKRIGLAMLLAVSGWPVQTKAQRPDVLLPQAPVYQRMAHALARPDSVRHLDLSWHGLGRLPAAVVRLPQLEYLDASRNVIDSVQLDLHKLAHLRHLNLAHNSLRHVPDALGRIASLHHLDLQDNLIRQLPASLVGLHQLRELDLSFNPLNAATEILGSLPALEVLRLRGCGLTDWPLQSISPRLRVLDLQTNRLRQLPDVLSQCSQLQELNASYNQLTELPADLSAWTSLKRLHLRKNQLRDLPESLYSLPNLEFLDLRQNPRLDRACHDRLRSAFPKAKLLF